MRDIYIYIAKTFKSRSLLKIITDFKLMSKKKKYISDVEIPPLSPFNLLADLRYLLFCVIDDIFILNIFFFFKSRTGIMRVLLSTAAVQRVYIN